MDTVEPVKADANNAVTPWIGEMLLAMRARWPLSTTYCGKTSDGPPSVDTAITARWWLSATDFRIGLITAHGAQLCAKK